MMSDCEFTEFINEPLFPGIDIPQHWNKFTESFDEMRRKAILVDVKLVCKGRKFYAHRAFLSAACEYFYHMFTGNMCETEQSEIELLSCEPEGVELLLDILYTGQFRDVKLQEMPGVLTVLHLINITEAFEYYRQNFLDQLSVSNFLDFWTVAETLEDTQILKAVYDLTPSTYKTSDFSKISEVRLKRLLEYLDAKETTSHDLKYQIVLQWTNTCVHTRLSRFSNLLESIDFSKVSDYQLIEIMQHPLLTKSDVLMNKILSISRDRFLFMMALDKVNVLNDHIVNMFLIGKDGRNKLVIQYCKMGQWMKEISLEEYGDLVEADIVHFNYNLHLITKDSQGKIMLNKLGSNGETNTSLLLGNVPMDSKMTVGQTGYCTAVIGYLPTQQEYTFIRYFKKDGKVLEDQRQLYFKNMKEVQLRLIGTKKQLFLLLITQSPSDDLKIFLRQYCVTANHWKDLASISVGEGSLRTPCFWHMTLSHLVARFFPGMSYYFSLIHLKFEEREENNDVPNVVSSDFHSNTAWILDNIGQIFVQDLNCTASPWKLITRAPTALDSYQKLVTPCGKF